MNVRLRSTGAVFLAAAGAFLTRVVSAYLVLWSLSTQVLTSLLPYVPARPPGRFPLVQERVAWAAWAVFGVRPPVTGMSGTGGDTLFDHVQLFCLVVLTVVLAVLWGRAGRPAIVERPLPKYTRQPGPRSSVISNTSPPTVVDSFRRWSPSSDLALVLVISKGDVRIT